MTQFTVKIIPANSISKQSTAIIQLHKVIKPANYKALIVTAKELVAAGHTQMILDLGELTQLNLTALLALYRIAKIVNKQQFTEPENGWNALHEMADSFFEQAVVNLKLCVPQPHVAQALKFAGFYDIMGVFPTQDQAVRAFGRTAVSLPFRSHKTPYLAATA